MTKEKAVPKKGRPIEFRGEQMKLLLKLKRGDYFFTDATPQEVQAYASKYKISVSAKIYQVNLALFCANFVQMKKGLKLKSSETLVFAGGSNRIRTASRMG
jgi:hypothetical protein